MTIYKITNITENFGKRDRNLNKVLEISYVDQMERKSITLKPKETVYLTVPSLPIDIHSLRIKGLVNVSEISSRELKNIQKTTNKKEVKKIVDTTTTTIKPSVVKSKGKKVLTTKEKTE